MLLVWWALKENVCSMVGIEKKTAAATMATRVAESCGRMVVLINVSCIACVCVGRSILVLHIQTAFSRILGGEKGSDATPIAVYFCTSTSAGDAN